MKAAKLIIAGLGLVGICISGLIIYIIFGPRSGTWRPVANTPSRAIQILGVAPVDHSIFVRTVDGHIYSCDFYSTKACVRSNASPEQIAQIEQEQAQHPGIGLAQRMDSVPRTKGQVKVIDSLTFNFLAIDVTVSTNAVLLEDGSLWTWTPNWLPFSN